MVGNKIEMKIPAKGFIMRISMLSWEMQVPFPHGCVQEDVRIAKRLGLL
jgi:hypothetical protein